MNILASLREALAPTTAGLAKLKDELDARRDELVSLQRAPVAPEELLGRCRALVTRAAADLDLDGFGHLIFPDGRALPSWGPPAGFGLLALFDAEALATALAARLEERADRKGGRRLPAEARARRLAELEAEIARLDGERRQIVDDLDRARNALGAVEIEAEAKRAATAAAQRADAMKVHIVGKESPLPGRSAAA